MSTRTYTPTNDQLSEFIGTLYYGDTPIKALLKTIKDKHVKWIVGKKRVKTLVKALQSNNENNEYSQKITKVDTPVSSKNILSNSRRPQSLATITNSPMLSGSDADDSDYELPSDDLQQKYEFSRPGSGLKPKQNEFKELVRQMDLAEVEIEQQTTTQPMMTLPRSIIFVPDDDEDEVVEEQEDAEELLAEATISKLENFFNREKVTFTATEKSIQEAEILKDQSISKLKAFFNRKRNTTVDEGESKSAVSCEDVVLVDEIVTTFTNDIIEAVKEEEKVQDELKDDTSPMMLEFKLPPLPLARIETIPVVEEEEVDEYSVQKNSKIRSVSTEDTTCKACLIM